MRVLHVSAELVHGGVENWLLSVARYFSGHGQGTDIAVTGEIDPRVRAGFEQLGARVFACPDTYQPLRMIRNLQRILRREGPYDVLHCHVHRGNAWAALAGRLSGVPAIVAHSHLNCDAEDAAGGWRERAKGWAAATLQRTFAHQGLACSQAAGEYLFGSRYRRHWRVHYCGIDLARFRRAVDRQAARRQLHIPGNAFVIGHVGRFQPVKNHSFLLDLTARYTAANDDSCFVLVGDGALLPVMEERARRDGLAPRIRFLGARDDVPELLLGLFDAFLLPSLSEGLPISLLEAQAAGLPALVSDRIPSEARLLPAIEVLRIGQPLADWCAALDRLRGRRVDPSIGLGLLGEAGFDVELSAQQLDRHYSDLLRSSRRAWKMGPPSRRSDR